MSENVIQSNMDGCAGSTLSQFSMGGYAIQSAIWPQDGIPSDPGAFLTSNDPEAVELSSNGFCVFAGKKVSVDGYFTIFNLGKWRTFCGNQPIELQFRGAGKFFLTVWVVEDIGLRRDVLAREITLEGVSRLSLDLPDRLNGGSVLAFDLVARTDVVIDDFAWATSVPPPFTPKLTLAVTTFLREVEVSEAAARFCKFRKNSRLEPFLDMIIVDNGKSLDLKPVSGVRIVQNENYGGAAGFARGLIESSAKGSTHCLFMDDDASIQMRAIERTWMFLAYSKDPKTAVCGAMIDGRHPHLMWENGATFDRSCRPMYLGLNLTDKRSVVSMELYTTEPFPKNFYAGWWFFAFPISSVRYLPFPFFVRGDDVSFSLANDFSFVTLPGVASVQENFIDKASPLTWYLDMRSHLAHHLSLPDAEVTWWELRVMFRSFYLRTVLRFHYETLSAVNLAIEDVLNGPDFFVANISMEERRGVLNTLTLNERWLPIDYTPTERRGRLPRLARAILLLTLNGHLLPFANTFGSKLVIDADHRENYREVYGARSITYLNGDKTRAYTLKRDRRRFWHETRRLLRNLLDLRREYRTLKLQWRSAYPELASERFWRSKLKIDDF